MNKKSSRRKGHRAPGKGSFGPKPSIATNQTVLNWVEIPLSLQGNSSGRPVLKDLLTDTVYDGYLTLLALVAPRLTNLKTTWNYFKLIRVELTVKPSTFYAANITQAVAIAPTSDTPTGSKNYSFVSSLDSHRNVSWVHDTRLSYSGFKVPGENGFLTVDKLDELPGGFYWASPDNFNVDARYAMVYIRVLFNFRGIKV